MSTVTGTQSMNYNSANIRGQFKRQQRYTTQRMEALTISSDYARMTLMNNERNVGIQWVDVPYSKTEVGGTGPANVFTSTGDRKGFFTTLAPKGAHWRLANTETALQYTGDAKLAQLYAYLTFAPTDDNYSLSRSLAVGAPNNGGDGYGVDEKPVVTFSGGTAGKVDPLVTGIVEASAVTGFTYTSVGAGYDQGDGPSSATIAAPINGGTTATISGAPAIESQTLLRAMFYKNGEALVDTPGNVSQSIGDHHDKIATNDITISIVTSIEKNDIFELRLETNSAKVVGYRFHNVTMSIRPLSLYGN